MIVYRVADAPHILESHTSHLTLDRDDSARHRSAILRCSVHRLFGLCSGFNASKARHRRHYQVQLANLLPTCKMSYKRLQNATSLLELHAVSNKCRAPLYNPSVLGIHLSDPARLRRQKGQHVSIGNDKIRDWVRLTGKGRNSGVRNSNNKLVESYGVFPHAHSYASTKRGVMYDDHWLYVVLDITCRRITVSVKCGCSDNHWQVATELKTSLAYFPNITHVVDAFIMPFTMQAYRTADPAFL
ncbi:hypothetical protein F5Y18DRAFT_21149 [Xylariaceae sp. FL1019]|nr:hypothetical protein F5Y18DRAFT_21149 [Xylariaceae sp. FL1019]